MGHMAFRKVLVTALAATAVLAGCASPRALPPSATPAEVRAVIAEQNRQWWDSIAPGEPMPVIEPIEYADPKGINPGLNECMSSIDTTVQGSWDRAMFTCSMLYPYDYAEPEAFGIYSRAQLEFLYDYFSRRLSPCLEFLGYEVPEGPSLEGFTAGEFSGWTPYYAMRPTPLTAAEWRRIDLRCPVPPIGVFYRPGLDYAVEP